jgi:hypothetical protein
VENKQLARLSTLQNEASAAHESMPVEIQPKLRRSCGPARDHTNETEKHTPRLLRGVRVIQRFLALQNSRKSTTQSLIDFTIQFLAKTQTPKLYSVRPTVCVTCAGVDGGTPSNEKKAEAKKMPENAQTPQRQVHVLLASRRFKGTNFQLR